MCKQLEHLEYLEHVARNLGKFAAFQHAPRCSSAHVASTSSASSRGSSQARDRESGNRSQKIECNKKCGTPGTPPENTENQRRFLRVTWRATWHSTAHHNLAHHRQSRPSEEWRW